MPIPSAHGPRRLRHHTDDTTIFGLWVEEHGSDLYRFAYRLCGDKGAGEDLVQETFFEAWKHRGPLRSIREPRAWLLMILRRRYLRMRRSEQRRPWLVSLAANQDFAATPDPRMGQLETSDALQPALDSMSDLFKLPLLMVFMQGLTCAQAAEVLDIPLGTVLSRIHRAKQHLRASIQRDDQDRPAVSCGTDTEGMLDSSPRLRIGGAS